MNVPQIIRPPPKDLFFAPLQVCLTPGEVEKVQFAYICSKYGHHGQVRDHGGRYFDHPKGAAWIYISELGGRDVRIICDILLHDLQEDCYLLSTYRAALNFGSEIALDVHALTKLPKGKETLSQYLQRVIDQGPRAIVAKLLDRIHNIRELGARTADKIAKQVAETREFHLKLLPPALAAFGGEWEELSKKLEALLREALQPYQ